MTDYIFELDFEVRDYECDLQGVVNNSIYMNYLEHTRHQFLKELGFDFAELNEQSILPMVYKAEMEFKSPLKSGDLFTVKVKVSKKGHLKALFHQDIYRKSDQKLMLKGIITAVILDHGKPVKPDHLLHKIVHLL